MNHKIIAVSGVRGSGKSESADMLMYCLSAPSFLQNYWCFKLFGKNISSKKWTKTSFAHPLKKMLSVLLNVPVESFEDRDFKENIYVDFKSLNLIRNPDKENRYNDNQFNKAIKNGDCFYSDKLLSIRQLMQFYGTELMQLVFGKSIWILSTLKNVNTNTVISDLRFIEEAKYVHECYGKIIYIDRPGTTFSNHISEQEMSTMLDNGTYDHIIYNNGSLKDLFKQIKEYVNTQCMSNC